MNLIYFENRTTGKKYHQKHPPFITADSLGKPPSILFSNYPNEWLNDHDILIKTEEGQNIIWNIDTQRWENGPDDIIYYGPRGNDFKELIKNILSRSNLKKKYINVLISEESMNRYSQAFTHSTADSDNNYEFLEKLGDATLNTCIVWYISKRFPIIIGPHGPNILGRLKIRYVSKAEFSPIAEKLGFWSFISAEENIRNRQKRKLLEDTFESFFGLTALILDEHFMVGVGYSICYDLVKSIFDDVDMTLNYFGLWDPKTRIKELFEYFNGMKDKRKIGTFRYEVHEDVAENGTMHRVNLMVKFDGKNTEVSLGEGIAPLKIDAEQRASEMAFKHLKERGWERPRPQFYVAYPEYYKY